MSRSLRRILHPVARLLVLLALGCVRKAAPPPAPPSLPVPSPAIPSDVRERFRSALSPAAVVACPVTRPNVFYPPGFLPDIEMAGYNVRNREATLWARLKPEGALLFYPGGPGRVEPDGSLSVDLSWYRVGLTGPLRVEGRRLDAPAPPLSTASVIGWKVPLREDGCGWSCGRDGPRRRASGWSSGRSMDGWPNASGRLLA